MHFLSPREKKKITLRKSPYIFRKLKFLVLILRNSLYPPPSPTEKKQQQQNN